MENSELDKEEPANHEQMWAGVRMLLGFGQMMGAVTGAYFLVMTGLNELTLGAVLVTCTLTTISVLLFGRRKG
jgi:hypothetical protein